MFTVYLAIAALIVAACDVLFLGEAVVGALLTWILVFPVGLGGVWAFLGHYFKSDEVAGYIGWPAGNPFQKEVAFTNLATGTCGLLSFFFRDGFRLATIVFVSIFLLGAFLVHSKEQKKSDNQNPGNAGPIYFSDIVIPFALWGLYLVS